MNEWLTECSDVHGMRVHLLSPNALMLQQLSSCLGYKQSGAMSALLVIFLDA